MKQPKQGYLFRTKLRKITVDKNSYLSLIRIDNDDSIAMIFLQIYLKDHKKTPLLIRFSDINSSREKQSIYAGITLENKTDQTNVVFNINEPKWVRQFILHGIKIGWNGENKIEIQNGEEILEQWGYDLSKIFRKENGRLI